ncbi:MAG: HAD family hydrolase [Actinomycetota bacterium]|nr:HAD family hydrolase [Actinomycetota bacterium]MDH5224173.1 HAD family hydrolase [Actinomycetota bacterium]MDH5313734.1 HAD family hydrolase [Actinomycetota bacterium]
MNRRIDAVVFDMDGTLFDSMQPVTRGFIDTIVEAGGPRYSPAQIIASFPRGPSDRMLEHLLGRPVTEAERGAYHRRLDRAAAAMCPYPGVETALGALNHAGLRLALFTGADVVSLELLLARTGLRERFEVRTGGDEAGRPKPDPAGITLTCARLGVEASAVAYVGDSEHDMLAARAAGTFAIGAGWGSLWHDGHPAHVIVRSPQELLAAVQDLASPRAGRDARPAADAV